MNNEKPTVDLKKAMNVEHPTEYYVAILLGLIFLFVSFLKLMNPQDFAGAVFRGHIVPYPLVNGAALFLMSIEFVSAFSIVFVPTFRRTALWILMSVLLVYTGFTLFNLLRDLHTTCACFGSNTRAAAISWGTIVRNLGVLAATLFALR